MFVELNRGESQKYLDQMKQDLSSPSNNDPSTLSRGGSFPPSAGSGLQSQGCLTGFYLHAVLQYTFIVQYSSMILMMVHLDSGSGVLWRDSYSPISPPSYGMLSQVSQICLL